MPPDPTLTDDEGWSKFITIQPGAYPWTRPGLDVRSRRILVIGTMIAIGRWEEFQMHAAAAMREGGVSLDDLKEIVIIHLNGWPGSGKLTVARVVARKLDARLLDNHTLHDVAGRLCDRYTREYWELYYQVRDVAYKRVRALPSHEVIVMTNALTLESDREREAWAAVKALAVDRGVPLVAVTLQCSLDENVRRIASEGRHHGKLTDPVPLIEWRSTLTLLTDGSVRSLTIDNTNRSPDQVADEIVGFVRGIELVKP